MAVRLGRELHNFEIGIESLGVTLEVRPLTTAIWEAAHAKARRIAVELRSGETTVKEIGGRTMDLPDMEDPDQLKGFQQLIFTQALAMAAVVAWQGVLLPDSDEPAPVTPANVMAVMNMHQVAETFVHRYTARMEALLTEGKGFGPSPNGTSAATAPNTAAAANGSKQPAPGAE